jgi:hypothetical protein
LRGAHFAYRKECPRKIQEYLIALSTGFLLAPVFFDLIPKNLQHLSGSTPHPRDYRSGYGVTPIVVFAGVLLFYFSQLAVGSFLGNG